MALHHYRPHLPAAFCDTGSGWSLGGTRHVPCDVRPAASGWLLGSDHYNTVTISYAQLPHSSGDV